MEPDAEEAHEHVVEAQFQLGSYRYARHCRSQHLQTGCEGIHQGGQQPSPVHSADCTAGYRYVGLLGMSGGVESHPQHLYCTENGLCREAGAHWPPFVFSQNWRQRRTPQMQRLSWKFQVENIFQLFFLLIYLRNIMIGIP